MSETKPVRIEIDPSAGFCYGVKKAIAKAEGQLALDELSSLGEIVHNAEEQSRLEAMGLRTIAHSDLPAMKGKKVLIRAHGEPPSTFEKAKAHQVELVDASCPIVLGIQKKVKLAYEDALKTKGKVVIFGKPEHPETIGLVGHTESTAIVIRNREELDQFDFNHPIYLFAQTTMNPGEYLEIERILSDRFRQNDLDPAAFLKSTDSICRHVSNREQLLREFARNHQLVLFVSGKNSSNGKLLFSYALAENANTQFISNASEIDPAWLSEISSVGVTGATSTPAWLMEEVRKACEQLTTGL
jgi:4-hydroxy-3-methylbut-2-en-1-yl diphosphate reductase